MAEQYWGACQTMPGREHIIRSEIEKADRGAFLPTYARTWVSDGKVSARETALMPGYVFFKTDAEGWGDVSNIDGVQAVLSHSPDIVRRVAKRVTDDEMMRLVLGHATGAGDRIEAPVRSEQARRERKSSSRKPRRSNRIRSRNRINTDQ